MDEWNIPLLEIGGRKVKLIQGGMGVGISGANLASAVANEGGAGIIASVGLGASKGYFAEQIKENQSRIETITDSNERQKIFEEIYASSNKLGLIEEIKLARKKSNGFIGVNIMHVLSDYGTLVEGAVEGGADAIITGAGIPRDLPNYVEGKKTLIIPIVSRGDIAEFVCSSWAKRGHLPDAVIIEGPKAGGHLGYSREELADPNFIACGLEQRFQDVRKIVQQYETSSKKIPIILAGGIYYGGDIKRVLDLGAAGVQMATRFVPTEECDADIKFKQAYTNCNEEDIILINSPVGLPGRAIRNQFLDEVAAGKRHPIACPYHCIRKCVPEKSPYCIAKALREAQQGKFDNGYVFCGSNAHLTKEDGIIPVRKVFEKLNQEYLEGKVSS